MLRRRDRLMRRKYIGYEGFLCHLTVDPNLSTFPVWKRVEDDTRIAHPKITIASDVATIKALIKKNRNYLTRRDPPGFSCLHQVCSIHSPGRLEVLKIFSCSKKADVNVRDRHGRTPLHHALSPVNLEYHSKSEGGSHLLPLIETLIDLGANVNALDEDGISPFHLALDVYNSGFAGWVLTLPAVLAKFIAGGADFSLSVPLPVGRDDRPFIVTSTVVHLACCISGPASLGAVGLLLTSENVNSRDSVKRSPLHDLVSSIGRPPLNSTSSQDELDLEEKMLISKLSLLLDIGADVNAMDPRGCTPLGLATANHSGFWESPPTGLYSRISSIVISMLINRGASAHMPLSEMPSITPSHLVCGYGDRFTPNTLQRFLKAGAQPEAEDYNGLTLFHYAVMSKKCRLSTLSQLWDAGADVTATDMDGNNALHFVCKRPNPDFELVKLLVKMGCNIDDRNRLGETPLLLSLNSWENQKFVEFLIDSGADVRLADSLCFSSWHAVLGWLSRRSETFGSLIHKLIQAGSDVNGGKRKALLCEAMRLSNGDDLEVVKLLLLAGANPNVRGCGGETPLNMACCSRNLAPAELLLEFGADLRLFGFQGNSPLHCAIGPCQKNCPNDQIVDMIIKRGADINAKNNAGVAPLHCATYSAVYIHTNPNKDIKRNAIGSIRRALQLLLIAGADPNVGDPNNLRPLHIAASNGDSALCKLLLDYGADPNLVDTLGHTPLHKATSCNKGEPNATWIILVANGANPSARDLMGRTSLMVSSFKTYKPYIAFIALMISTGRYRLHKDEKMNLHYFDRGKYYCSNDKRDHFHACLTYAHLLSEVSVGPMKLAEFLLGPTDRPRKLMTNPEIAREILLLRENPDYTMFSSFFDYKLLLLHSTNAVSDAAIKAIERLYAKPLPLLVSEKILYHLTDMDLDSLAKI